MSTKRVSRRQFVRRTLAASAVAACPHIVKAAVSKPPSEKLNVAVIGLGAIGGWHARQMTKAEEAGEVNFVGMCDADWGYDPVKKNFGTYPNVKRYRGMRWIESSIGQCGNFGPHHFDASYFALQLGPPETIEADSIPKAPKYGWPKGAKVTWQFPARGSLPPVKSSGGTEEGCKKGRLNAYRHARKDRGAIHDDCYRT